jgi:hypothetical protein
MTSAIANQESLSILEVEMRKLEAVTKEIVDELGYLQRREMRMRDTNGQFMFRSLSLPCQREHRMAESHTFKRPTPCICPRILKPPPVEQHVPRIFLVDPRTLLWCSNSLYIGHV